MEASTLSATGLALQNIVSPLDISSEEPQPGEASGPRVFNRIPVARLEFNFDQGWLFFRPGADSDPHRVLSSSDDKLPTLTEAEWEQVALPHTVRLEPRDVSGSLNYQGICWYKKRFPIRSEWKNRVLYLKFQAAMQVADLWLNGVHLTTHYGGYTPFTVDISKAVLFGQDNVLAVRLDNSDHPEVPPGKPQKSLDFVYFGGLYRSVQFEVLDPLHITDPILADKVAGGGIFVTYDEVSTTASLVTVKTDVANESAARRGCTVVQELVGHDGRVAAVNKVNADVLPHASYAVTQTMQVDSPRLWHPDDPYLYLLHTTIVEGGRVVDDQYSRIGIRSIRFDKEHGFFLNGQPYLSIGANRHQDHPYVGYALSASAHYRDAYKLREAGFTSCRSHYPQDPSFMDACDELGILTIVSNPGWQFVGDEVFKERVYQNARLMIRRDRNRPSVILWEAGLNESDSSSLAAHLYRIVHEEHPGTQCYSSGDTLSKPVQGFPGWDVEYSQWEGYDSGYRQGDRSKPWWIREWGDQVDNWSDQQGRVRAARSWGETPLLVQAAGHLRSLEQIYSHGNLPAGADLWAGVDYYRGYHHQPFLGSPLDLFRLPKLDYFLFQSQRPPDAKPAGVGSGPMVFIANFASFQSPSEVTVFSNCEQVRLYQNGKEVATQKPDAGYHVPHPPFTFKVGDFSNTRTMLFSNGVAPSGTEIGELRAEGLISGRVAASHLIRSPGVPTSIRLELDTCGLDPVADGSDWVRVYAHIRDARGTTYPYADDMVTFSVSGQGSLIGDERIFANPLRAEAGIATALVRMAKVAGTVTVRACAPGLQEAGLEFEARASHAPTSLRL